MALCYIASVWAFADFQSHGLLAPAWQGAWQDEVKRFCTRAWRTFLRDTAEQATEQQLVLLGGLHSACVECVCWFAGLCGGAVHDCAAGARAVHPWPVGSANSVHKPSQARPFVKRLGIVKVPIHLPRLSWASVGSGVPNFERCAPLKQCKGTTPPNIIMLTSVTQLSAYVSTTKQLPYNVF